MNIKKVKKNRPNKHLFSELIIGMLTFFMAILILYATAQISVVHFLETRIKQQNAIVDNQRAKRELGSLIKEKIIHIDLYFQKILVSNNRYARENLFRQANKLLDSLETLLPILELGGRFTHRIPVNLNTTDEVVEEIHYNKDSIDEKQTKIVVEAIVTLPKIDDLRTLLSKIRSAQISMENFQGTIEATSSQKETSEKLLLQYALEADTLLLRCRENSNKIFFDTHQELKKLIIERERLITRFETVGKYFYLAFQVLITIMFFFIFMRIIKILKTATAAEDENRKLLSAIKQSPLSVVMTDRQGCIEYVNPSFETTTGYSSCEVIGQKASILSSGRHNRAFYKQMWDELLSGRIWQNEIQNKKKNGDLFWESTTLIPVADSRQEITHFVAIKEDMTEKINLLKSYEESNAIFEEIFANLPVGLVLISAEKRILQVNREAERILGYEPGKGDSVLRGKICHNNYCTLQEDECPIYDLEQSKVVLKEREALKQNGIIVKILKSVIPIKLKGEDVLLEAFMDLSAVKQAEQATLEAKNAAEFANRSKSEFLANMSHEIRTPMNAIIGFSDLLMAGETDATTRDQLKIISQSAHGLLNLINEILDFSKIEAGKIKIENAPFSLNALLNQLSSMFLINARAKHLAIEVIIEQGTPEYAVGDELRLRQVLVNLTGNAIKFTRQGSVTLRARYKAPDFFVEVHDTGVGIPQKNIQNIFKAFEQAENSTERVYGGTGLGLSISQSLVRLMGGKIEVESQENKGSRFIIRLPMEIPENQALQAKQLQTKRPGQPDPSQPKSNFSSTTFLDSKAVKAQSCLVVEDSHVNSALIRTHLQRMNLGCDAAENGKIALEMMAVTRYDIVFMDMHMPVMNGLETLKKMKDTNALSQIPVVAITADAIKGHGEKYLQDGFDAYISKPFSAGILESTVQHILPDAFAASNETPCVTEIKKKNNTHGTTQAGSPLFHPSDADTALIEKSIALLHSNCDLFNPEELNELSAQLKATITHRGLIALADEINIAAESFDDGALPDILSQFKALAKCTVGMQTEEMKNE